jgi:peptidoglycan/xylan/chitin deacetylase (PgdA/CDA1 family)
MSGATRNTILSELEFHRYTYVLVFIRILLIPVHSALAQVGDPPFELLHGAIVRGDSAKAELALVFTGDEYADGGFHISRVLSSQDVLASFFLTGKFYRNPEFDTLIRTLVKKGHYLGAHSDQHLLYCSWENRDSLLVSRVEFQNDLLDNYRVMQEFGINKEHAPFFLPPFEWYNDSIAAWTRDLDLQLVNFTHGTLSHTDYTIPEASNYRSSREIYQSILEYESTAGLNGFILLVHIGTAPERRDKFYLQLEQLLNELKSRGYGFKRIDELLKPGVKTGHHRRK